MIFLWFFRCVLCLTRYANWSREAVCPACARRERDAKVVLAIKPGKPTAVVVIGDAGIGVIMPTGEHSAELDGPMYDGLRRRLRASGGKPR